MARVADATRADCHLELDELDDLINEVQSLLDADLDEAAQMAEEVVEAAHRAEAFCHKARALIQRGWARFGLGDMAAVEDDNPGAFFNIRLPVNLQRARTRSISASVVTTVVDLVGSSPNE